MTRTFHDAHAVNRLIRPRPEFRQCLARALDLHLKAAVDAAHVEEIGEDRRGCSDFSPIPGDRVYAPRMLLKTVAVELGEIYVPAKLRSTLDPKKVQEFADTILNSGLPAPIQLRRDEDRKRYVLVTGLHRLEAMRAVGETMIQAVLVQARKH
jgi:sulfiredoxin